MDLITWPLLAALGLLSACGTVMYNVAAPALIPALVPANLLPRANARIELARTVAFASGPALGGTLVSSTGAGTAFGTAAGLSILAVMMLIGLQEPPRAVGVRRRVLQEAAEGARFVARHHLLRPVLITQFIFNTAFFAILAVLVPYAARHLQLEASGVGWTLACYGAGMMIGALLAPSAMRRTAFGTVIGIGPVAGFAASLLLMATIWAPYPAIAGASLFLLGVGPILWTISTTTLRQAVTPPNLLGRVSAMSTLAHGARPIGAGLGALIGSLLGAEACLVAATIGFAAQAVVILRSPAVGLLKQPDSLADDGWSPKSA
jgi:predicted MFS family arabinose efflux permease